MAFRTLILRLPSLLSSSRSLSLSSGPPLLRHLVTLADCIPTSTFPGCASARALSTRATTSSLKDPQPNWSNRPPKETILLDGCDFEHWLVVMETPDPSLTRDEIIDYYIKTLAKVVGSEEEARMKLYSVSTKHYFAFGCLVSEELSYKINALDKVRWVLPDSYLDVKNKDYGGEPVIDGVLVPYDPKYHEEWVRNNSRPRPIDKPRDRSTNFERRRENIHSFQNKDALPMTPNMPPREPSNAVGGNIPAGSGPVYQGGSPGYQGANRGNQGYPGNNSGYQGVNQGYPGNNSGYQGVNQGYPGNSSGYQGGNQGYSVNNLGYQRGGPGYQGGNQGYSGNNTGYQGGGPVYQGGNEGYRGNNPGYQGGNQGYQGGGEVAGRDYQYRLLSGRAFQ